MDKADKELLVRIDERTGRLMEEMKIFNESPCILHTEKIKTLEKITYGAMLAALLATVKSFW